MLLTKRESVDKYCPFKFGSNMEPKVCANENCMAWEKAPALPTTREEMGYCGLAGEPSAEDRR